MLRFGHHGRVVGLVAAGLAIGLVGASVALADVPTPNPTPGAGTGIDVTSPGSAARIHGDPVAGAQKFATNCAACHGPSGTTGISNPGSDDGSVPVLKPIDPGFLVGAHDDPAVLAAEVDAFVQHGSRPSGPNPTISMPGFGDHGLLAQADIADIEAYVMSVNGVFWPDRCPGVLLDLANPSAGTRIEIGSYVVSGRAMDARASQGAGVSRVDIYLDSRESGGRFLGTATPGSGTVGPTSFQVVVSLPKSPGAHNLVAYAFSSVTSQESVVSIPVALGMDANKVFTVTPQVQSSACAP